MEIGKAVLRKSSKSNGDVIEVYEKFVQVLQRQQNLEAG